MMTGKNWKYSPNGREIYDSNTGHTICHFYDYDTTSAEENAKFILCAVRALSENHAMQKTVKSMAELADILGLHL